MIQDMTNGDGAAQPRGLVRRVEERMVAGVCAGLAHHYGADPVLFRLGFVALGVLGGAGIVVYLAAWALVPAYGGNDGTLARRALPALAMMLLAAAGTFALAETTNLSIPFLGDESVLALEPLGFAAALVAIGLVLLRAREEGGAPAPASATAETAVLAPHGRVRRPRERSGLAAITLALALLAGGGAAAGASAGWAPLDVGQVAALTLVLVGAGLLVGAWYGRARLLIVVGMLMVPVVLVASLIDYPPAGSIGDIYVKPSRPGELGNLRVLAGQATLDLVDYPFVKGTERVRLRVAAGSMTVILPHDVRVDARVSLEAGEAHVFRGYESGMGVGVVDSAGPEDTSKKLELEIVAGVGTVGVYRMNDPRRHRRDRGKDQGTRSEGRDGRRNRNDERGGKGRKS
jgi:phage shock protein PspC (stress-responsive transcriptional regulator)